MWWRLMASEFERQRGERAKNAMKRVVESGEVPGILAYSEGEPVAWCSIGPRERFPRLERSPFLKRIDDQPVWSIVCFFVARPCRRRGVSEQLTLAALDYARGQGADIVEAYPVEPRKTRYPAVSAWTGFASTFQKLGFEEVLRRKQTRPIMRYYLKDG
jgi:GNAT superfamily N-acetyltransferase